MSDKNKGKIKLLPRIYEMLATGNFAERGEDYVIKDIVKAFKQKVSPSDVRAALNVLESKGSIIRVKHKGYSSIKVNQTELSGTYFFISDKVGGYIKKDNSEETFAVDVRASKNAITGEKVKFMVNNNAAVVTTKIPNNGKTDTGIKVDTRKTLAGIVMLDDAGSPKFISHDRRLKPLTVLTDRKNELFKNALGSIVTVERNNFVGGEDTVTIKKVYGKIGDPLPETNAIADEAGVILELSAKALAELDNIPDSVNMNDYNLFEYNKETFNGKFYGSKKNKINATDDYAITIDPATAQDMDDAISTLLLPNGNFLQRSYIADVTEYIKPNTELWDNSSSQGFSLYTPAGVFALLPKHISHGICSLNPDVERLVMCFESEIDAKTGERIVKSNKIYPSIIKSKHKLDYGRVQEILDGMTDNQKSAILNKVKSNVSEDGLCKPLTLEENLVVHEACSNAIWKNFKARETLSVDNDNELKFILNEDKTKVLDIVPRENFASCKVIEAFMINANEVAAEYMNKNDINGLYRKHAAPDEDKIEKLTELMNVLDVKFNGRSDNRSLGDLIKSVEGTTLQKTVTDMVLRSLKKANYGALPHETEETSDKHGKEEIENTICHNALASEYYSHITAGIRRCVDLISQYAIKEYLYNHKNAFTRDYVLELGPIQSANELRIDKASRDLNDLYSAIYAEDHINDIFDGIVRSISERGVKVETPKGLIVDVPVTDFVKGNCSVSDNLTTIFNSNGEIALTLGDKTQVKLSAADRMERVVYGSTNLEKIYVNPFDYSKADNTMTPELKSKIIETRAFEKGFEITLLEGTMAYKEEKKRKQGKQFKISNDNAIKNKQEETIKKIENDQEKKEKEALKKFMNPDNGGREKK